MPQRGNASRDKVAQAVAGAEAIEIRAALSHRQRRPALAHFGLTEHNGEERFV